MFVNFILNRWKFYSYEVKKYKGTNSVMSKKFKIRQTDEHIPVDLKLPEMGMPQT